MQDKLYFSLGLMSLEEILVSRLESHRDDYIRLHGRGCQEEVVSQY